MKITIGVKLFFALLLGCSLVLLASQFFVHWSFRQGLMELVESREQARLADIAEQLTAHWSEHGDWEALRTDLARWAALLARHPDSRPSAGQSHGRDERLRRWLGPLPHSGADWPPPELLERLRAQHRPLPLELRLMLLDAEGHLVIGRPELLEGARRHPLRHGGQSIGALAILPGPPLPEQAEQRFLRRQVGLLWVIALGVLLLSAALAYPLSLRLTRPLRRLQQTARALAAGDYSARVGARGGDEIARLGQDLDALASALEHNEQARRRWVADISHELRTPIALLRAELEAVQDGMRPLAPELIERLHGDVLRLARLVDDLYELSVTDLGALGYRFERCDLDALLSAELDAFGERFAAAGLRLSRSAAASGPVLVRGDPQRLSQALRNLLQNSLHYTDPGGALEIRLRVEAQRVLIEFEDSAPGVPEAALAHLFERLYRVDAARGRHRGGAGLGLAIVHNVVEAHGGRVSAAQAPAGGLLIRLELPV